jgi:MFS family permease
MTPDHPLAADPGDPEALRGGPGADPPGRWTVLTLLALAQLLGMSLWFTASATSTQLATLWDLDPATAGSLTMAVQVGFVAGTAVAALLNLADLVPARGYVAAAALLAAAANASIILAVGPVSALAARFLTGFFLAGVYPPAMKMAATWFRASRGLAIGIIVGALTVGKAAPYLIAAFREVDYRFVALSTSAGAVTAALLVLATYRDGPFPFARLPFDWRLAGTILRHRPSRLAIAGYLGHMWELYAMWAASLMMLRAHFLSQGMQTDESTLLAGLWAFGFIAIGGPGSVLAGAWADRLGRENVAAVAMAVSGSCALVIGWLVAAPTWVILTVGLIWGFTVVADSAQFSALVTEVAPPHAVGTALTLQTSLGFLLTAGSIWLTIELAEAMGWGVACSTLAIGPAVGIIAILRLRSLRRGRRVP